MTLQFLFILWSVLFMVRMDAVKSDLYWIQWIVPVGLKVQRAFETASSVFLVSQLSSLTKMRCGLKRTRSRTTGQGCVPANTFTMHCACPGQLLSHNLTQTQTHFLLIPTHLWLLICVPEHAEIMYEWKFKKYSWQPMWQEIIFFHSTNKLIQVWKDLSLSFLSCS